MINAKYHDSCKLPLDPNDIIVVSVPYMGGYNGDRLIRVLAGRYFEPRLSVDYCYGFRIKTIKTKRK